MRIGLAYPGYPRSHRNRIRHLKPRDFHVAYQELVADCDLAERLIHRRLAGARVNRSREFFAVELADAIQVVRAVAAEVGAPEVQPKTSINREARMLHAMVSRVWQSSTARSPDVGQMGPIRPRSPRNWVRARHGAPLAKAANPRACGRRGAFRNSGQPDQMSYVGVSYVFVTERDEVTGDVVSPTGRGNIPPVKQRSASNSVGARFTRRPSRTAGPAPRHRPRGSCGGGS